MRWKIRDFVLCEQQQTLSSPQHSVRIEPMMSELLAYFCHHQGVVVSKEQLLNDVWHGRYVSDNSIAKLVTKLRKALGDDARNPMYIVTIPKRGYRLVAPVEQISEPSELTEVQHSGSAASERSLPSSFLGMVLLVAIATAVGGFYWLYDAAPSIATSAKALTADRGSEHFPAFTSDGERLAYMHHDGHRYRLFVKLVASESVVEIRHGKEEGVGPGSWNDKGNRLVYLVATKDKCQYFTREFHGLHMSEPELIHTCKPGSYGVVKFTHDDNLVVFAESPGPGKPYSLYQLDITTRQVQWLPQPELHLGGNSQFDLHPKEDKLLISSPDQHQWEGFYELDLNTRTLTQLFKLNAYICCGIWSHDGKHVVLMGEHPAREIVRYDLDGNNKTLIYSGTQQLSRPERHSNGEDYVFIAYQYDLNVEEYHLVEGQTQAILQDTVDERLAVLSPDEMQVAYISLTTGSEELWLYNRQSGQKQKVTGFDDSRHYLDLAWSPDQTRVAGLTLNAIHIIDVGTGDVTALSLPEKELRGISFKSATELAFSMQLGKNWQVVSYDLVSDVMTRLDPQWQSVRFDASPDNWLWVNQEQQWFYGEDVTPLTMPELPLTPFAGRQFAMQKAGDYLAYFDWSKQQLEVFNQREGSLVAELESQIGHFSIRGNNVLISRKASKVNNSDIYQTQQRSASF